MVTEPEADAVTPVEAAEREALLTVTLPDGAAPDGAVPEGAVTLTPGIEEAPAGDVATAGSLVMTEGCEVITEGMPVTTPRELVWVKKVVKGLL